MFNLNYTSIKLFQDFFSISPYTSSSANGRVNLIGDHTDYNYGLVMPSPLSLKLDISILPSDNGKIRGISNYFGSKERLLNEELDKSWLDFIKGGLEVFYKKYNDFDGIFKKGIKVAVNSSIPPGAGISSSAAISVAILKAISYAERKEIGNNEIAVLAQKIEHDFIGTKCGLMDQMVATNGIYNNAMFYNLKTNKIKNIKLFKNHNFLVIHSGIKRKLSEGNYNKRLNDCTEASRKMGVLRLSDAKLSMTSKLKGKLKKRALHVLSENLRVKGCFNFLKNNNSNAFGKMMFDSHESLSKNYEVSSPELDNLILFSKEIGAEGARLTGAGFGGCIVVLVDKKYSEEFLIRLKRKFKDIWLVDKI